jgi:hypothetical protein
MKYPSIMNSLGRSVKIVLCGLYVSLLTNFLTPPSPGKKSESSPLEYRTRGRFLSSGEKTHLLVCTVFLLTETFVQVQEFSAFFFFWSV